MMNPKAIVKRLLEFRDMTDYQYNHHEFKQFLLNEFLVYFGKNKLFLGQFLTMLITPKVRHRNKIWKGKIINFSDSDHRWLFCHETWLLIQKYDFNN